MAKGKGVDLAIVLGGKPTKSKPMGDDMEGDDMGMEEQSESEEEELPADFMSAFDEYEAAEPGSPERARALYRAIEFCKGM